MGRSKADSEKKKRQEARVKAAVQAALAQLDAKKAAASPPGIVPKTGKIAQAQAAAPQQPQQQQPLPPIKGVSKAVMAKIAQIQNQQMAAANAVPKTKQVAVTPPATAPAAKTASQQQAQIAAAAAAAAAAAVAAINQSPLTPPPPTQPAKKIATAVADEEGMDSAQEVETGGQTDEKQKTSDKQTATA